MISFAAVSLAWGDISRKGLLRSKSNSELSPFHFRSFMVSGLSFKSLIHFELILGFGVRECVISPVSMWAVPNTICWRNDPFLIVCSLHFCYKLIDFICMSLCLGSQFHSIDLCTFFCKYCAVLISILCKQCGIGKCGLFSFVLFLGTPWVISSLFWFHINSRFFLFNFCEKLPLYFDRDCAKSVDCFRSYGHFNNVNSSNSWAQNIFSFIYVFFHFGSFTYRSNLFLGIWSFLWQL